jgi:hypothetical protein
MNENNHYYMICLLDCVFVIQRIGIEDVEGAEDKGGNRSISQGKSCLEAEGEGRNGRREQVTIFNVYIPIYMISFEIMPFWVTIVFQCIVSILCVLIIF